MLFFPDDSNLCNDFFWGKEECKKELCKKEYVNLGSSMAKFIKYIEDTRSSLDVYVFIITHKDVG